MEFFKDLRRGATIALGFLLTLGVTALFAQSLNEFAGGDLISASKINANFANLKSRLDNPVQIQEAVGTNHSITSYSNTDVNGLSITVTTGGSPVWVGLGSNPGGEGLIQLTSNAAPTNGADARIYILRDSTVISTVTPRFSQDTAGRISIHYLPGSIWTIDNPGAGTYTYKIQARCNATCDYINFQQVKMMAMRFNEN